MSEMHDLKAKVKKYYRFTPAELRGLVISILIIGFIVSFREWGPGNDVMLSVGLFNWFNSSLLAALTLLAFISAQKIVSLQAGLNAEYRMSMWALSFGLLVAFVSRGYIWFLIPGGIIFHHMAGHRLGWYRYDVNYFALAILSLWGPIANIVLAIIFKIINGFIFHPMFQKAIALNLVFAVYSILPIPPAAGNKVYFGSRMLYAFSLVLVVAAAVFLWIDIPIWIAIGGALAVAVVGWLLYYTIWEKDMWQSPYAKMREK